MNKISKKIIDWMKNYIDHPSEEEIEIAEYGITSFLINIYKIPIFFLIAYLLGILKYYMLTTFLFSIIKMHSWGIHMRSGFTCILATLVSFVLIIYISIFFNICIFIKLLLSTISLYFLYKYAPADTEERPCLNENIRKKFKKRSIIIGMIYVICSFAYPSQIVSNIFILILFLQTICILPFTYNVFHRRYNNYEYY